FSGLTALTAEFTVGEGKLMLSYSSLRVCMVSMTLFCVPSWRRTL
ncbi:hypothetical protein HMPREF0774_2141, partial [Staphylococcus aureus subsp. aureus TCH130]